MKKPEYPQNHFEMKALMILWLVFLATSLHSQTPIWRIDNTVLNPTVIVTDLAGDGRYTYLSIQDFDIYQRTYLQKLDSAGNVLHADTIDYSYAICDSRMARDAEGYLYTCGQMDSSGQHSKIKLVKSDSLLNKVWVVSANDSVATDYYSGRIVYSNFENAIFIICQKSHPTGTSTAILKFNTSGDLLWESDSIPTLGLNCIRFGIDHSGNIILGGMVDFPGTDEDFTLVKVNPAGTITWSVSLHTVLDDRVEDIAIDDQDNIYAFSFFADAVSFRVYKYDSAGNFIWATSMPGFTGTKIATDASGVYVSGVDSASNKFSMVRLDTSGVITATNSVTQIASGIIGMSINDQSHIYACYTTDSASDYRWAVSKFDSSLNEDWTLTYPDTTPAFAYPASFLRLDDGFIVSGKIDPYISTVRFRELVPVNIGERQSGHVAFWPNPAGRELFFAFKKSSEENILFQLYDAGMQRVFETCSQGHQSYRVDLPHLPDGIYFFGMTNGDDYYFEKIIIHN